MKLERDKHFWPVFTIQVLGRPWKLNEGQGTLMLTDPNWAPSSEFVSLSIPSLQTLTAHAQSFRGARDLAFCLKVPLDPLLVWASSGGFGETARMRRLAWTFAARIGDKYQIRLTRSNYTFHSLIWYHAIGNTFFVLSVLLWHLNWVKVSKPNHFLHLSQWCIHARLVRIHQMGFQIESKNDSFYHLKSPQRRIQDIV